MTEERMDSRQAAKAARRAALVDLLAGGEGVGLTRNELARRVGLKNYTGLRRYMDEAFWAEVDALRRKRAADPLHDVDVAMLVAARAGNVGAARLVYARLSGKVVEDEGEDIESLLKEMDELRVKLAKG